jgi:CelD/BcsL family acetyltransferase involved in cellulose biosynthesis
MNMALTSTPFEQMKTDAPIKDLKTQVLDSNELLALGAEWEELVDHALEENAYYCRHYCEALLAHIEKRPVRAIAVWKGTRLIALLPFITERSHWAGIVAINIGWTTPYTTSSIPLIDRRNVEEAVDALLTAMGDRATGSDIWILPNQTLEGSANSALGKGMGERGVRSQAFDSFDRAVLERRGTFDDHMKEHLSKKRRKDLRRNRKRLDELGEVAWGVHTKGPALNGAVDAFLRIEASGWKGNRGTALDCQETTRAFAKQAFGDQGRGAITRADVLSLDGQAIAINLTLMAGRTGFTIKCAFDETFKAQSAGLLLEEEMIRNVLEGDWTDRLDSATAAGHLITSFWNDTVVVGDLLIDANPNAGNTRFRIFEALETTRRSVRSKVKTIVNRMRP